MPRHTRVRQQRYPSRVREKDNESRFRVVLEHDLSLVLASIATLLISSGYSYEKLSKAARAAFVVAASKILEGEGRKPTVAQLAATTGLSRAEVSSIVRQKNHQSSKPSEILSRAANMAAGWMSDPTFLNSQRRPRPLAFKGQNADFSELAKRYSGDIPARAMLREMERLRMVSRDEEGTIWLARPRARITKANVRAMRAVAPWVNLLQESIQNAQSKHLSSSTSRIELGFDSIPQVLAVLGELKRRRSAFVHGISELGARRSRGTDYPMRITIAVAVDRPKKLKEKLPE